MSNFSNIIIARNILNSKNRLPTSCKFLQTSLNRLANFLEIQKKKYNKRNIDF